MVSYINSPSYLMAKFFNNIFKSVPKPFSNIKNSFEFINKIKNLMSLDVIFLFTNIPLDLVLISIEKRWYYISKFTELSLEQFKLGIKILMEQTFLKFNYRFYRQTFGTRMGSHISPFLADFVMQDLETDIFKKIEFDIPVYFRYVDDTFLLIPKEKIYYILTMFNSYHKRLQFTYELENNNCLNFLNISVIKNSDNTISTNWFRKETFSGRFLNYFSLHPLHQKIGIIKNLVDFTILLSDNKFHHHNLNIVSKLLSLNSFPIQFIDKHIKKRLKIFI